MSCPTCKQEIKEVRYQPIVDELNKLKALRADVQQKALAEAHNQGLDQDERLQRPGINYEETLTEMAMHSCAFYECARCHKPYFGGMVDCAGQLNVEEQTKKEDLKCKDCIFELIRASEPGRGQCERHDK